MPSMSDEFMRKTRRETTKRKLERLKAEIGQLSLMYRAIVGKPLEALVEVLESMDKEIEDSLRDAPVGIKTLLGDKP